MMKKALIFLFFLIVICIPQWSYGDVIPAQNSTVHYVHVYFEENFFKGTLEYELKIYSDSSALRKDSAVVTLSNNYPAFRVHYLNWGKSYLWRVNNINKKNKRIHTGDVHTFSIVPRVNSDFFSDIRLDVRVNDTTKHLGGYIVIDYLRGIFDRSGRPVWLLPPIAGYVNTGTQIRDLEFTAENTLTFLSDNTPVELDLEGKVLWSLPSPFVFGKDTITFHHDFKKTAQGTYFMLGNRSVYRKMLVNYTEELKKLNRDVTYIKGEPYAKTDVAVLLELDQTGKVLWFWDSNNYLTDEDLNYKKTPIGFPLVYAHANALGVNDENTKAYIGFRDLSRIIKIDKQSKKVELSYGEKYPSGEAMFGDGLFRQQHDARVTKHNSIFILNNNGARKTASPSCIMELKDNVSAGDSVLLWKFDLDFDTLTNGRSNSGGNITEMPNSNILLCAGQLNRFFEVTRKKEIVWDAFVYSLGKKDSIWQPMPNYRSSWIPELKMGHILTKVISVEKRRKNLLQVELTIYNVNDKEDSYLVEFLDEKGLILYSEKIGPIRKDLMFPAVFKFSRGAAPLKSLKVKISSLNYPVIVKNIVIPLK
ncbi:MAG: aryl-sulfate sulfotransferase [bacterium]|nr:aryl-sulfate sulfotransferase [bacterium]